jgi:hypothetical protein
MRLACHYLESKSIHPVDASELPSANGAALEPATLDASSATRQDSEEVQSEGPERVRGPILAAACFVAAVMRSHEAYVSVVESWTRWAACSAALASSQDQGTRRRGGSQPATRRLHAEYMLLLRVAAGCQACT